MQRRHFLKPSAVTAGALTLFNNRSLASIFADPYNFKPLRNNMGIFTERGGTIAWLSNKDGIVVVDAEFADTAPHVIAELQKQSTAPFNWLINTHHHGDHTGGNIAFKGVVKNVAAHENSLQNQQNVPNKPNPDGTNNEASQLYPDTTFSKEW